MKKLAAPVALIMFILLFCTVCVKITDDICTEASMLLEEADRWAEQGDMERAETLSRESWTLWESNEGFLGMVLRHTESDDISCLYPVLLDCCRVKNIEEYCSRNHELRANLRHLSRMEIPYYFNIL